LIPLTGPGLFRIPHSRGSNLLIASGVSRNPYRLLCPTDLGPRLCKYGSLIDSLPTSLSVSFPCPPKQSVEGSHRPIATAASTKPIIARFVPDRKSAKSLRFKTARKLLGTTFVSCEITKRNEIRHLERDTKVVWPRNPAKSLGNESQSAKSLGELWHENCRTHEIYLGNRKKVTGNEKIMQKNVQTPQKMHSKSCEVCKLFIADGWHGSCAPPNKKFRRFQ
jgi:hypothetical protein